MSRDNPLTWILAAAIFAAPFIWVFAGDCHVPSSYEVVSEDGLIGGERSGEVIYTEVGLEEAIIVETNRLRAENGLEPLSHEPRIREIARAHSVNMARQDRMEHVLGGKDPTDRAISGNYRCRKYHDDGSYSYGLSENVGVISDDVSMSLDEKAREFVQMWYESPGHRANMLDREAVKIGVGVAIGDSSLLDDTFRRAVFATQNFAAC